MISRQVKIPSKTYQKVLDLTDTYSADVWVSVVDIFYSVNCQPLAADDCIFSSPPGYSIDERNTNTLPIPPMRGKITMGRLHILAQCGLLTKPNGAKLPDPGLADFIPQLFLTEKARL